MPATTLPNPSDHYIPLSTAVSMTSLYRSKRESILQPNYQDLDTLPLSETFHKTAIDLLLNTNGCLGLRIYYGMDVHEKVHAILVAVDGNNRDILPANDSLSTDNEEPIIIEVGQRCPPSCPPSSDLNT